MPTANIGLPYLSSSQANKEIKHNEALAMLDVLVQGRVLDKDSTAPPVAADGDAYIVASPATGEWTGYETYIAVWFDESGIWVFILPKEGWRVWVADEDLYYLFNGTAWVNWAPVPSTNNITASTTQTQVGSTALTAQENRVTTCANANDAVGLPQAVAGRSCGIVNNGAQAAGVWPKTTGDAIDGGAANAVDANALPAGSYRRYHCFTTGTWRTLFTDA